MTSPYQLWFFLMQHRKLLYHSCRVMGNSQRIAIATANNFHHLIVESDSITAVNFIQKGCSSVHPCYSITSDILLLANRLHDVNWSHTLREGNSIADLLARKAHDL
ncbi:hypothetical protein PIB30_006602 [Stylosanthes scabra]|uniref:RNase H type-1 domain-containing protein n=1 Tax=Stylosanthes scabra TaxID=79078 RepID=A0ABU6Z124_9FABA|nr:hypothetical protein [Stylosanthes scabra]